jgi:catechol 2,3-dioxygenase-like lactoylglutathione lyase family enzyme
MAAQLNHTIVWCSDKHRSSAFLADVLGLPPPEPLFHFMVVALDNGVSLDFMEKSDGAPAKQHYAFLVDDSAFDAGFQRIKDQGLTFWADPAQSKPGEINRRFKGRGFYFEDPDGHLLELLTMPYTEEPA